MRLTVVHPRELGPDEAALWSQFQRATPATENPFLSLTFAQAVGRARDTARVAVIEEAGVIEGFFAFELATASRAVPIGWPLNDCQAIIRSGVAFDARSLIKKAGLRVWRYDHLLASQNEFSRFHRSTVRSPIIDLSGGHDNYLSQLREHSKNVLTQIGRRQRKLEREVGVFTVTWRSSRPTDFSTVIAWKSEQYHRTEAPDVFADPTARQITEDLAATGSDDCAGIVNVLSIDDEPIAAHFGLLGPHELSWWFPVYATQFAAYSPGVILLLALAGEAAERGITRIDLGAGEQRYKTRLANDFRTLARGAAYASRFEHAGRKTYRRLRSWRSSDLRPAQLPSPATAEPETLTPLVPNTVS